MTTQIKARSLRVDKQREVLTAMLFLILHGLLWAFVTIRHLMR